MRAIGCWNHPRVPDISPRIIAAINSLGSELPFPLMRQPLPCPVGVGTSIFQRHPSDRLVGPSIGVNTVRPILEEVVVVLRAIVSCFHEFFELCIRNWI